MRVSPIDSIHNLDVFVNDIGSLLDVPRESGILSPKEVSITEQWDVKGLLKEIATKKLSSEEVALAFCKVYTFVPMLHTLNYF